MIGLEWNQAYKSGVVPTCILSVVSVQCSCIRNRSGVGRAERGFVSWKDRGRLGRAEFERGCIRNTVWIQRVLIGDRYALRSERVIFKGPFTPETRSTPALSRSGKMDGSAMSGPWSGRAYVGLKYSGGWSGPLWEVVVSGISFSTDWKLVGDDPALHRSHVERGYSVVVGGTA